MDLLVCVINNEEKVNEILTGFLDLGVTGATVIGSQGMGRLLSGDTPVLAGLQALIAQSRPLNKTIFSVIESAAQCDAAVEMIERICGDMTRAGSGIVFTVPVTRVVGLAPRLAPSDS